MQCSKCNVLTSFLQDLSRRAETQKSKDVDNRKHRVSMRIKQRRLLSILERSENRCSRLNHIVSHLMSENQKKDKLIFHLLGSGTKIGTKELDCASSLLQLASQVR
jgi:hypothetical protein